MKEKIVKILVLLFFGTCAFIAGNFIGQDDALRTVMIAGFLAAATAITIELIRADREEKFRRQDRAMNIAKSISRSLFQIQNTNYVASISGSLTSDLNKMAMDAQAELEESRAAAIMFLGDKAGNLIAEMVNLLGRLVGEMHCKKGSEFDLVECAAFASFVDKHSEMMQMLKDYAENEK